jgi:hypothetical protein
MESKPAAVRMRSYAVEIKGIGRLEMLINKLPGKLCVGKLQPRQPDSILGNLSYGPRTQDVRWHIFCCSRELFHFVGEPDIVNYTDSTGDIMKKRKDLAVFARRQPSRKGERVSCYLQFHLAAQREIR